MQEGELKWFALYDPYRIWLTNNNWLQKLGLGYQSINQSINQSTYSAPKSW